MPRVPKTLPAQLRQYYKTAPRPASSYGNDVFNFAADRLGRRSRAMRDLEDLDRYAMEQQARGRYNPDDLNALARQIEADRMLTEMDYNAYMEPRGRAAAERAAALNKKLDDFLNYQIGYRNLNRRNGFTTQQFMDMTPYFPPEKVDAWRRLAYNHRYDELLDNIHESNAHPVIQEASAFDLGQPENEELLEQIIPDDPGYYEDPEWDKMQEFAIAKYRDLNRRPVRYPRVFGDGRGGLIGPSDWRESLGNKRYR